MNDTTEDRNSTPTKPDDTVLAAIVLVVGLAIVLGVGYYLWKKKLIFASSDNSWQQTAFSPPPERGAYIEAKKRLNPEVPGELDDLKKLLMRRAIQTIPILLSLQTEGTSIERLYKKGILTDDMHFRVKELKAFVDQEFQDIQFEADDLVPGWGQSIWQQAMQFHQMIQRQLEAKNEEVRKTEEEKKKTTSEKKKAKKASATGTKEEPVSTKKELELETDPEVLKAQDAEKMAKMLLEEEENEKKKNAKKNNNKKK